MADCPLCEDWHYDPFGPAIPAWAPGNPIGPVIWDGEHLREAFGTEAPGGRPPAIGAHICFDHPDSDLARSVGPVQWQRPVFTPRVAPTGATPRRPWWKRLLPV